MLIRRTSRAPHLPPALPAALERRGGRRIHTVLRVARVARAHDAGLWRVRNISDGGMMMAASVPVTPGERLSVSLSDSVTLDAEVAWWDGARCGVAFDRPIDCAALLHDLVAEQRLPFYRPPRLPVSTRAIVYCEKGLHSVRLVQPLAARRRLFPRRPGGAGDAGHAAVRGRRRASRRRPLVARRPRRHVSGRALSLRPARKRLPPLAVEPFREPLVVEEAEPRHAGAADRGEQLVDPLVAGLAVGIEDQRRAAGIGVERGEPARQRRRGERPAVPGERARRVDGEPVRRAAACRRARAAAGRAAPCGWSSGWRRSA